MSRSPRCPVRVLVDLGLVHRSCGWGWGESSAFPSSAAPSPVEEEPGVNEAINHGGTETRCGRAATESVRALERWSVRALERWSGAAPGNNGPPQVGVFATRTRLKAGLRTTGSLKGNISRELTHVGTMNRSIPPSPHRSPPSGERDRRLGLGHFSGAISRTLSQTCSC